MSHDTRIVSRGRLYNAELKEAILQYSGLITEEDELWLYVCWPDIDVFIRFTAWRTHPRPEREEKAS